ncbi:hypothetical protein [Devosia sp. DBB001]|nr:hypothetical protein [Devosia sp. DBB001]
MVPHNEFCDFLSHIVLLGDLTRPGRPDEAGLLTLSAGWEYPIYPTHATKRRAPSA